MRSGVLLLFLLLLIACQRGPKSLSSTDDHLVAEIKNQKLYQSDISKTIADGITPEDSIILAQAYIERWIRESIILQEAEDNIPVDLDISKLVNDYRSKLIRMHYEKKIVEEQLDSTIRQEELETFYQEHKSQYLLKEDIVRCEIAVLDDDKKDLKKFEKYWEKEDKKAIKQYCEKNSKHYHLDNTEWISWTKLRSFIPIKVFSQASIKSNSKLKKNVEGSEYFLKIQEFRSINDEPPLIYIQDRLKNILLHKRKIQLMKDHTEFLYDQAAKKNLVKVFTK